MIDKPKKERYYLNRMEKMTDYDRCLASIKNQVRSLLPGSQIILFGSRSRGDFDRNSDYDVLVISKRDLDIKEKRLYQGTIRKKMAVLGIPIDVLVKTEKDVGFYRHKLGSVVREAVTSGIVL